MSRARVGIGSNGQGELMGEGDMDPPVDEYSSEEGSSTPSFSPSGSRQEQEDRPRYKKVDFAEQEDDEDNEDDERSSGSRSSGTCSTVESTGFVPESLPHHGMPPSFRSSEEKGASPIASTPLRSTSAANSSTAVDAPSEGQGEWNGPTPASASPMGPHVRRILEALASFDGGSPDDDTVAPKEGQDFEHDKSAISGRDDNVAPDAFEIRKPGRVKHTSRSVSGSSEASSSRNHSKKKKARTEYGGAKDPELNASAEMLDISAIISQVDRKSLDDELDQLVRELDEAVGRDVDATCKGIKLRRRSRRRRSRKGRSAASSASHHGKRRKAVAYDDDDDEEADESRSPDPSARDFMNMAAAEDWMAREAYSSDDSVIEDSSCMTTQTEEQVKGSVQDPTEAEAETEMESPAIKALRDAWSSFTLAPLFDGTNGADTVNAAAESEGDAVKAEGKDEPKKPPHEPNFLEFIDPAFFEELWKALLSIQIQNCRPLDMFRGHTAAGDSTLSTKEPTGECSVSSTIPTDAPSLDVCDSLSMCSGTVPTDTEVIDHSAILAKCLARGGADGGDVGTAGSSPLAKRKAALLLQQCEKKFPSLYKRIIARLESKAGVKGPEGDRAGSTEAGATQPSRINADEDDSLFSTSRANTSTTAELANKTPRVRNSRRDVSIVELSGSESREIDAEEALAFTTQDSNVLDSPSNNGSANSHYFIAAATNTRADPSQIPMENQFHEIEDLEDAPDFALASPTDAREYSLLTSFNASDVDDESPPAAPSLEDLHHLAVQGVVSPLTVDSNAFTENMEGPGMAQSEQGAEVTDILADLTTTDFEGWNMSTDGEGASVIRVKDLRESLQKKVPILTPKSTDTSRPRRVRHSSAPRGWMSSDRFSDDQFPVVLQHRVLSHTTAEMRKSSSSRLKPRKLEGVLDRSPTPKARRESPDERRSPTSFPSLFVKGSAADGSTNESALHGAEIRRDDCPDVAPSLPRPASLSRSFTLPTPSRPSWSKLDSPPRNSFNDSLEDSAGPSNVSAPTPDENQEFDLDSQWVAFPTPPRGTFRAEEVEADDVPILASPPSSPDAFGSAPLKGTGKPTPMAMTAARRSVVALAGRSKSTGRAANRESSLRMLASSRPSSEAKPIQKARFRRLVSAEAALGASGIPQ